MFTRSWMIVCLGLLVTVVGCKTTSRRVVREPIVEEYNLPPSDPKISEGPHYPDQKRQLPSQAREQQNALAGKGFGAGAGSGAMNR